jgi:hypothetical protein
METDAAPGIIGQMDAAGKAPFYLALLVAGLAFAITVRFNGFVAPYTDPAGYVGAGSRWLAGDLYRPVAAQFHPQLPNRDSVGSPLGFRPGTVAGTDVSEYPLGLPVGLAAAMAPFGELGAHLVGPACAALLVWSTFAVGAAMAGGWAGVLAAVLIAASPVTLRHAVYVSSDVPCAAFLVLAWRLSLRPGAGAAAAAGAAATAAVMIRPNAAPLAAVAGSLVLLGGASATFAWREWRWRHALIFAAMAAVGPAMVMWSNAVLYGGPLQASYREVATFFARDHIVPNLRRYPLWLIQTHSNAALAGLAAVPLAWWRARRSPDSRTGLVVAHSAAAMVAINAAIIFPYLVFEQWTYLRFMLPAMAALFILLAALMVWAARALMQTRWSRWLAPLALAPAALVIWYGVPEGQSALRDWRVTHPVLLMGRYLREVVPPNAVVLSFMHGGTVEHFTGRPIVRMDLIVPDLDRVIDLLQRQGYRPVIVLDEVMEAPHMARTYPTSQFKELDWPPRASFAAFGRIWYLDPADRKAYQAGVTYVTDVLR